MSGFLGWGKKEVEGPGKGIWFWFTTLEWKEGGKKSTNWSFSILSYNSRVLRNALRNEYDKIFHSTKNNYRFDIFLRYLRRKKFSSINPPPTPHPPIPCPNTTYAWHNYLGFLWDPALEVRHIRTRNYKVSILSLVSLNALSESQMRSQDRLCCINKWPQSWISS